MEQTMIIDAHTHIFTDKMIQDRSLFFTNEPEFRLLYDSDKSAMASARNTLETMDEFNVDKSVICGFPWRTPEFAVQNNDAVIDAVRTYPGRFIGLACMDVSWKGAADETQRCINEGLSGAGELAFYLSGIDEGAIEALAPVMEVLRANQNLPCMIHTNEPVGHKYPGKSPITLEQIYDLAKAFPDNRIILAHWGGGILFYNIMKKETPQVLKNIWYDTAATLFLFQPAIYDMAVIAGLEDRIMFGTDYPLLKPGRYYKDLDSAASLTQAQKEKILGLNAAALFGI